MTNEYRLVDDVDGAEGTGDCVGGTDSFTDGNIGDLVGPRVGSADENTFGPGVGGTDGGDGSAVVGNIFGASVGNNVCTLVSMVGDLDGD